MQIPTTPPASLNELLTVEYLAPIGALLLAGLYLWLGPRRFGADDDWWKPLRHRLLPHLDRWLGQCLDRGYATKTQGDDEYAVTVDLSVDELERVLEEHGGIRNVAAAAMTDVRGRESAGSWAFREVRQPQLRLLLHVLQRLPLAGSTLRLLEEIVAMRQVHLRLYRRRDGATDVYAHEEPNAINPLTALAHYTGRSQQLFGERWPGQRVGVGIGWTRTHFSRWGLPTTRTDPGPAPDVDVDGDGDGDNSES